MELQVLYQLKQYTDCVRALINTRDKNMASLATTVMELMKC